MDDAIRYLNSDLDLVSPHDLTALAAALEARGLFSLHETHADDGLWHASFETDEPHEEPEPNVASMMAVIESLAEPLRAAWAGCTRREFNIGYACGATPRTVSHELSSELLARIAAAGASLRVTLYAAESPSKPD